MHVLAAFCFSWIKFFKNFSGSFCYISFLLFCFVNMLPSLVNYRSHIQLQVLKKGKAQLKISKVFIALLIVLTASIPVFHKTSLMSDFCLFIVFVVDVWLIQNGDINQWVFLRHKIPIYWCSILDVNSCRYLIFLSYLVVSIMAGLIGTLMWLILQRDLSWKHFSNSYANYFWSMCEFKKFSIAYSSGRPDLWISCVGTLCANAQFRASLFLLHLLFDYLS